MPESIKLLNFTFLLSAVFAVSIAAANEPPPLAIEGYSPVSYFTEGKPEKGSEDFASVYNGERYLLTDAEQLALFEADPEAYAPLFPNHCPYSLALGRAVAIDPTNFKIAGDALLLFHRSDEIDGLELWNAHEDEEELLTEARRQWTILRF